MLTHRYGVPS
ncbi:hypothetical protein NITHO_4790009 [Nitrolancea hollandica Lb]|uniref:Uncharacterized protein n=1 Tax=Nitrolancea hollandica Lb TaxID=1129897 RepID=I4EKT1_9BACT|nr:hypothetical protein NITHO_4790009 [Nitrolancea hollandica Lb]